MAYSIKQITAILSNHGMPLENCASAAEELCGRHKADIDSIKEERDSLKAENANIAALKEQLEESQKKLEEAENKIKTAEKDNYKGKWESVTQELEQLKADTAAKETATAKQTALKSKLKEAGYSDRATSLIIRNGFADSVEFDENNKAKNLDEIIKTIQSDNDFSGFTPEIKETKHTPANPPANTGGKKSMSWDDIDKIKDTGERQKAIAANMDALGIK